MNAFFYLSQFVLQTAIWPLTRLCLRFFLHLEIRGLENLKIAFTYGRTQMLSFQNQRKSGVIFAVNHSSEIDPILLPASLPFLSPLMPMFYTSREKAFYQTSRWRQFFYGGLFFKLWGAYPVLVGRQNYAESLATHIEILQFGRSICIFPEGRKTRDGAICAEARGGVAYLSYCSRAAVFPVRIRGIFKMTIADFFLRKRTVEIIFGQPLSCAELFEASEPPSVEAIKAAANRVLKSIQQL